MKLEKQQQLLDQIDKASLHYSIAQLKWRGFLPWRRFVENVKMSYREADQLRDMVLTKKAWTKWLDRTLKRQRERESVAISHYEIVLLRSVLAAWIKVRLGGNKLKSMWNCCVVASV